jgi:hypothetical protein
VPIHDEIVRWVSEDRVVDGVAALGVRDDHGAVGGANHRYLHPVDRRGRRVALDDLRARSRLCGDAEDRDGGLTTYWTTPSGLHPTSREKEHTVTMSDPDDEPDDP